MGEGGLSTRLFYFPLLGCGASFRSGLKSQPESPPLTQLPAILRGWIESWDIPGNASLKLQLRRAQSEECPETVGLLLVFAFLLGEWMNEGPRHDTK